MGRMYSAVVDNVAVTAVQDIFEITAPADAVVVVHSIRVTQKSDYGDAAAEGLRITLERATGSGSGGSAVTPTPMQVGDPAFGGTVERNNTTQATTRTVLQADAWNIQAGYFHQPTPEERIVISPSGIFAVGLNTAPTDSLDVSATIIFEEIGG